MASLNKVFLMGNMTRDPELRYTPSGTAVCEFGLAVSRQWTTPEGERKEDTCFVDCQMWGRRGEVISEYLRKGSPIFVEGRLSLDQWEKDGQRRSRLRVVAENFEFIGGRGEGGGGQRGSGPGEAGGRQSSGRQRPAPGAAPGATPGHAASGPEGGTGGSKAQDDDIPF